MQVHGPRDVPELRQHLIKQWNTKGGFYGIRQVSVTGEEHADIGGGDWDARVLPKAQNFYVSADMCDVLTAMEQQLPETTILAPEMMPSLNGLVVFGKRLSGIDAEMGTSAPSVDAILWGQVQIIDINGNAIANGVGICSYRAVDSENMEDLDFYALAAHATNLLTEDRNKTAVLAINNRITWVALGRSDWVLDKPVSHRHLRLDSEEQFASMTEDRRRMAALWLLMAEPKITHVDMSFGSRGEQRRAERSGYTPLVRVVDIAKRVRRTSSERSDVQHPWKKRVLIGSYWRRRPYHPSCPDCHAQKRACGHHPPVPILEHWAGPEDGEVSVSETVRVWQ